MKKHNNWLMVIEVFGVLIIMLCLPMLLHAQPTDPENPGGDPDAPIDGGLGLLLAAGIGYGVKKVRDYKKQKKFQESL